jgi:uncharacterized membrane protein YphA (DoxX/SURF4 family)
MKVLSQISRFFVGVLFIFSGLIKANDPVGTAIKLEEYFEVFANDFHSVFINLAHISLPIAIFVIIFETVLGFALLMQYRMVLTSCLLLLLILFFTFLTFYSAYFNKVTDCGCFGEAIKMTPWTSFSKDIVLLFFIGIIFMNRNKMKDALELKMNTIVVGIFTVITTWFTMHCYRHLPFIDMLAYKVGNNLPTLMKPSEPFKYKYIMLDKTTGKDVEFMQYPTDTNFKFKEMILLNPEAKAKITDYSVWNDEGDMTQYTFEGKRMMILVYSIEKSNVKSFEEISKLVKNLEGSGIESFILTSSDNEAAEKLRHEYQLGINYYFADATVLKTMMRSNPGIIYMENGTVKGKWHFNDVPTAEEVKRLN